MPFAIDINPYEFTGFLGGHPIKHLLSALGLACLTGMMRAEADALEAVEGA